MSSQLYWQQQLKAKHSRRLVWIVCALIISIIAWASWAELDEVIVGEGRVVPSQAIQQIQSLEGGLLAEVHVEQGQIVEQGQLLATLDNTRFKAAFQETRQQLQALAIEIRRLQAELESVRIDENLVDWQQRVKVVEVSVDTSELAEDVALAVEAEYLERLEQLMSRLQLEQQQIEQANQALNEARSHTSTLKQSLSFVSKELRLTKASVESGAIAEVELLKLQRDHVRLRGEVSSSRLNEKKLQAAKNEAITDLTNLAREYRTKARSQLTEAQNKYAQLNESQPALQDQLKRTALYSPLAGKVKEISRRTLGGVIKPGESMMEIVPIADKLIIETRILPKDIAYLRVGLEANIKFTAYDFVIYGGEKGKVTYISADALQEEDGTTYYKAHIETSPEQVNFDIIPGMQASVDILTGKKTVLNYWLKPLLRAKAAALREP
ncbi:HlyD family type I secretion periplasmic adaptor subunit [Motilimonas cestriensis]|uniref:HlyD family type I secretion periplasmic adaptor subunit n=1 Tax=Motilimonas cestriensis TaxID=2742685 RepID=UPI003DA1E8DF